MSRLASFSTPRTIAALLLLVPALLVPAAQANGGGLDITSAPPVIACGGTTYNRILFATDAASGSYLAAYSDPTGQIGVRWFLSSEHVRSSDSALGLSLYAGGVPMSDEHGQVAVGGGAVRFSTTDVGLYGNCVLPIGQMAPNVEYSGRLEGLVMQTTTTTSVDCEAITQTKISAGFLWLFVIGFGWIKAQHVTSIECSTDTSVTLEPDWIFKGPVVATIVPGAGAMVCFDGLCSGGV